MCLILRPNGTSSIRLFNGHKTITCYKVLDIKKYRNMDEYYWSSVIMCVIYPYKGVIKSSRKSTKISAIEQMDFRIEEGIHVYTRLDEAKRNFWHDRVIVPVLCQIEDFVAYDCVWNEAVFTKIRIHKRARNFKQPKYQGD